MLGTQKNAAEDGSWNVGKLGNLNELVRYETQALRQSEVADIMDGMCEWIIFGWMCAGDHRSTPVVRMKWMGCCSSGVVGRVGRVSRVGG